jgi:hypothetical protein
MLYTEEPARLAFGALIIKETLGLTDEETVELHKRKAIRPVTYGTLPQTL